MPDPESDLKSLKLELLSAKYDVISALKNHHNFKSLHNDVVIFMDRLNLLKDDYNSIFDSARNQVIPSLHSFTEQKGDRLLGAVAFQEEMLAQLQEFIDMHANCVYLLNLHRSLVSLESAVNQLSHCIDSPTQIKSGSWDDDDDDDDGGQLESDRIRDRLTKLGLNSEQRLEDVDEEAYRLCTSAVVTALEEVNDLYSQKPLFDKESVFVYQDLQKTWIRCKYRLSQHVDHLWHRWIKLDIPNKLAAKGSNANNNTNDVDTLSSTKIDSFLENPSQFLFGLSDSLSVDEMTKILTGQSCPTSDQMYCDQGEQGQRPTLVSEADSALMGCLTILAKPTLMTQLLRLTNALKEIKVRIMDKEETDFGQYGMPKSCILYPSWRLELWAPSSQLEENEEFLFESCRQLTSVFQDLSTYLYGIPLSSRRTTEDLERLVDIAVDQNAAWFDQDLAVRLIDGRFAAGSARPELLNQAEFLAPVTQTVFHLIGVAKECGFLRGFTSDESANLVTSSNMGGGASLIRSWLMNLSTLNQKRRTNHILESVRSLLTDRKLLFNLVEVGQDGAVCDKPMMDQVDRGHGNRIGADDLVSTPDAFGHDGKPDQIPMSFYSDADRADLGRYLDLGHFDFPKCKISETIPNLLQQISDILNEAEVYLNKFERDLAHQPFEPTKIEQLQDSQNNNNNTLVQQNTIAQSIFLVESLIELVPRILLLFTSLVPTLHADLAEKDGRYAALYYNNCMYLAHTCLTLGERQLYPLAERVMDLLAEQPNAPDWTDQLTILKRSAATSTCILVPQLRQSGLNCLLDYLRRERETLVQILGKANGFRDVRLPENYPRCDQAIKDCQARLFSIGHNLSPLPKSIFVRSIAILSNAVCAELVRDVLSLIDLTRWDCDPLLVLLNNIATAIPNLFESSQDGGKRSPQAQLAGTQLQSNLSRRVPEYARLCGIITFLSASSLSEIHDILWDSGKGPLATDYQLKSTELRDLIKAVYSSSSARDQFLKSLH